MRLPLETTGEFRWVLVPLVLSLAAARGATAHHFVGLPHYSYEENTLEYTAQTGPYDLLMVTAPGKPIPGEPATITFYIWERAGGWPYKQPVTLRVRKRLAFGANSVIFGPATREPNDQQHEFSVTFPDNGQFFTELTMDVEGRTEVIPFLLVVGSQSATNSASPATYSILIAIGLGLLVFLLLIRVVKVRQKRKQKQPSDQPAPQNEGKTCAPS